LRWALLLSCSLLTGCAALTNPVADGVPVRRLPPELLATSRESEKTIPLNLLRQSQPDAYRLDAGDVLGVYVEGILGQANQPPPVRYGEQGNVPPALGYPLPVRDDGTVPLPLVEPLNVKGMTISQAQEAVRQAYTVKRQILKPGREQIIVTLMYPRQYHVLVVRQDQVGGAATSAAPVTFAGGIVAGSTDTSPRRRGTGFSLDLPAYENDVLSAVTRTGGLPGTDAKNEILVLRGAGKSAADQAIAMQNLSGAIRIPLRLPPGAPIPFRPEDVILQTGDIVFIESRDTEYFYTGGLLFSGQYPVPRDYDLDVVEAIALVRGTLVNGGQNANNFTGQTLNAGIGFPNPSLVSVIRRTPGGGQVAIRVDLNRALRDPRERILVQPKDLIILQQTPGEAIAQYFTSTFFNFDLSSLVIHGQHTAARLSLTATTAPSTLIGIAP
jgi:protein involved in polysaccharide export with SLBB domain